MRRRLVVLLVVGLLTGIAPSGAIINGTPAGAGAWPAMAAVTGPDGQFCGGSVIAPRYVLTAAHCFYDSRAGGVPEGAGPFAVEIGGAQLGSAAAINVDSVIIHPGYDELRNVNDVALLRLASATTGPIQALATADSQVPAGQLADVIGYGATSPDGTSPSDRLLHTTVPVVGDGPCAASYDNIDAPRHLCAGEPGTADSPGNDSCQGDSGGPLIVGAGSQARQVGVVSFGELCGIDKPGVYAEVANYRSWIDGVLAGGAGTDPENPSPSSAGADASIFRVAPDGPTEAVSQAAAVSFNTFDRGEAEYGVLARADVFADALGGSSLAFGLAPLLFTGSGGALPDPTREELLRAVAGGGTIYILGGPAAVPAAIDSEIRSLGFEPRRLSGSVREETAAAIAEEVAALHGGGTAPLDHVIVATAQNWPDAVAGGQIGSWWGVPILLTAPTALHPATRSELEALAPQSILVLGGPAAISDAVFGQLRGLAPEVLRLAGANRLSTAAAVAQYHLDLFPAVGLDPPQIAVSVNLWRADAFAHTLSASMFTGAFAGFFFPVDGVGGTGLSNDNARVACGQDVPLVVAGGTDLISDGAAQASRRALQGTCP